MFCLNPHAAPFQPLNPHAPIFQPRNSCPTVNPLQHELIKSNLKIGFLNVCHLLNKKHDIEDYILSHKVDIMMLAETFLTTSVSDDILRIQNYTLVRRDRPTHGGGLAAYVRDHLRARIVKADSQVEMLMLEVSGQRSKVLLGGVYRPPGTPVQFWQDLTNALDTVISTLPTSPLVLVGDFNVDVSSRDSPQLNSLLHLCNSFDIKNQVDSPTRIGPQGSQTTLDLALVGDDHVNSCVVVPCTISDHFALALDLRLTTSCTPTVRRGRNIARIDMGQFAHHLLNSDLENFCFARTEDEMWDMWLEKLVAALNTHAPIRLHRPRAPTRKSFPWKTPALHDLVQRRDAAHRRWKASPADPALRNVFTSARDEAKRMSRHLRAIYFRDLLAASQANARKTWQTINYLSGRNKSSVPPAVSVSQLSDQFSGVVSDPTRPLRLSAPLGPTKKECLEEFAPASVQEIAKLLSNIDVRKAAGSDQVPAAILKHCSPVLAPSLTILINASLASGVVPASLKIADVRPLFKSGDKAVAKNYRPISLLPIVSKVLERVVHTRLCKFLSGNSLFPANQFAYRPLHSTEDALTLAVDRYLEAADQQRHTGLVLVDMSKAFDKVKHQILVTDLFQLGITSTALSWFMSYLTDRRQRVVLSNGQSSALSPCECGVPQGSVLGPLLFSIYTMEIEQITAPAHSQLFADDILLDAISQSVEFLNLTLSSSVSNLANFLEERGLILNPSKTHVLALHASRRQPLLLNIECNGNPLAQTTNARYLGLHLDTQLRWETQVATITRKTSQKLTALRAIRSCLTEQQALLFYRSLILPDMLYGSNAFFSVLSAHQRHQLSVLDKRCIRCVANQPFPSHTDPIYTRLGLIPIIQNAHCKLRLLMLRIHTARISNLLSKRLRRQTEGVTRINDPNAYVVPATRRVSGDCRPLVSAVKLWNALPQEFKSPRLP